MSGGRELKLPAVFGDHMVLQREAPIPVWGWAASGADVEVTLGENAVTTTSGIDGRWRVALPAQPAGGPFELRVSSGRQELALKDVLIGEVWLCGGQSNMELPLRQARDPELEAASAADCPRLRFFTAGRVTARVPQEDVPGQWVVSEPETALAFSAVGFFFGRKLLQDLDVPVGLINSSWGGTVAQAWMPLSHLDANPALKHYADYVHRLESPDALAQYREELAAWETGIFHKDEGIASAAKGWSQADLPGKGWDPVPVPGAWEQTLKLNIDGAVWFRYELDIPVAWAGRDLVLHLGPIDDFDQTFFNGHPVGGTGEETPNAHLVPRRYRIPSELVRSGRAVLAVRIFDRYGVGGFTAQNASEMALVAPEGVIPERLPIAGTWRYRVERALVPKTPTCNAPVGPDNQNFPASLYNGMIAPLVPFGLRGVIWYQGESNADRVQAPEYNVLFPALINAWRDVWGRGSGTAEGSAMPFYFVQLANFMARQAQPGESAWAVLREAQLRALVVRHTGMAVAIDIGEAGDVHPKNKQDVGLRLALNALAKTYGKHVPYSGPMFRRLTIRDNRAVLEFSHSGGGLVARGDVLHGFAVAGENRRFVWADAKIDTTRGKGHTADTVIVTSRRVPKPVAVRYGWADNPDCTLVNDAGLPASPFRTDRWPVFT